MPYLPDQLTRDELEPRCSRPAADKAELNFQISRLADRMMQGMDGPPGYSELSNVHAAMIDAAHEFKRRFMDPYEDQKIVSNGDVYHVRLWGKSL